MRLRQKHWVNFGKVKSGSSKQWIANGCTNLHASLQVSLASPAQQAEKTSSRSIKNRKSIEIVENRLKSLKMYGAPGKSIEILKKQMKSSKILRNVRKSTEIFENLLKSSKIHQNPCNPRKSSKIKQKLWKSTEILENSPESSKILGNSPEFVKIHWNPRKPW